MKLPPSYASRRLCNGGRPCSRTMATAPMILRAGLRRGNGRASLSSLAGNTRCVGAPAARPSPLVSARCALQIASPACRRGPLHQNITRVSLQRHFSASAATATRSAIENTPLDSQEGSALLQGLDVHTVHAEDDGHPLAVYSIEGDSDGDDKNEQANERTPVLLLHGRTWSAVPVYHLVGRGASVEGGENRSLVEALYNTGRIQPYAMDFRGFGGTPKDESGFVEPLKCVSDAVSVLNWIRNKHSDDGSEGSAPSLLGWSHGALIAQIMAQRHPEALSKLILYSSIYNPNIKYSIPPPETEDPHWGHTDHDDFPVHEMATCNAYDNAMEDFTNEGMFPPLSAKLFAEAALVSDPIKVQWWNLHQLNECHPNLVNVPTMVIAGDQDPYAPPQTQAELFTNLGRDVDRTWSIIARADHSGHLSDERQRFVDNMTDFLQRRSF